MALTKRQRKEALGRGGQAKVARNLSLSEPTVSQVMNGKTQSLAKATVRLVHEAVAKEIGLTVEDTWGYTIEPLAVAS